MSLNKESIKKLAYLIQGSQRTMVLTGAGISTESGIPDFRGPGGLWSKVDPMHVFSTDTFLYRPKVFYETGLPLLDTLHNARPNIAHQIIAQLEGAGLVSSVATQNVDGLHQKAGSQRVFELHGHLRSATCMGCNLGISWDHLVNLTLEGPLPPRCGECGSVYKPDAVFFGDPLTTDFNHSLREASGSSLIIVVGSSLEVAPANTLPFLSNKLAIVNIGPTEADHRATIKIEAPAGETFSALWDELIDRGAVK